MEALADAAGAALPAAQEAQEAVEAAPAAAGAKRKRAGKLEVAQKKRDALAEQLEAAQAKVAAAAGGNLLHKGKRDKLAKAKQKQEQLEELLRVAEKALVDAREQAELQAAAAAAKEAAARERQEAAAALTEAAQLLLVELVMKKESRFTNTSDTADAVWAEIHSEWSRAVERGELAAADARSVDALRARYKTELGEFRLWCAVANRAMQESGVQADEVEEKVTQHWRPTTTIFRKHNYGAKPMSTPPFRVSGGGSYHNYVGSSGSSGGGSGDGDDGDGDGDDGDDDDGGGGDGDGYGSDTECSPTSLARRHARRQAAEEPAAGAPAAGPAPAGKKPAGKKPLHMGGASLPTHPPGGKKSGCLAESLDNFTAAFQQQQQQDREALREMQRAHAEECKKQREHEAALASRCHPQ